METTTATMNGFDLAGIGGTVAAIQDNPKVAEFQFRAENTWISGGHNRSTVQGFHGACQEDTSRMKPFVFECDEPQVLLGTDKGANPGEVLLYGLLACMTTAMVLLAAAKGIEVGRVSSKIEGDVDLRGFLGLDPEVPKEFTQLRVMFHIEGVTEDEKTTLLELARMSPIYNSLVNPIDVHVSAA